MGDRYCRFMGKRTQSANQWRKAARGGLWLDAARTVPNPAPRRLTPWGSLDWKHANVLRVATDDIQIRPVGSFPDDRGPYGAYDLIGGVTEFTREYQGDLRIAVGGNYGFVSHEFQLVIDEFNLRQEFSRNRVAGFRCVEEDASE
jgi:formylglycine-generating enzyme required for sulfatase activity